MRQWHTAIGHGPRLPCTVPGMTDRALLLTPSRGRGGGIERYVETLEWAFAAQGVHYRRVDLHGSGPAAQARLMTQVRGHLRTREESIRLVVVHRALLPVALLLARQRADCGISLVCHGSDVMGPRLRIRRLVENCLMRSSHVRVVAVSSFTAGVLSSGCLVPILPPGLSREWFDTLVRASGLAQRRHPEIGLVTAFRLADWREKGLPQLLDAVASLSRPEVRVTVCGRDEPSVELRRLVREHGFCSLKSGLSNDDLARHLAAADLCVLATRTRFGRNAYGEGFGLVLLEAQVAGTPVVAPAYGGSHDAYIEGLTGVAPANESAEALRTVLEGLIRDPERLAQMSKHAADWARECFAPEKYALLAVARLL
jgi:phosphatidyl-myo-inositol dimannoside synthase